MSYTTFKVKQVKKPEVAGRIGTVAGSSTSPQTLSLTRPSRTHSHNPLGYSEHPELTHTCKTPMYYQDIQNKLGFNHFVHRHNQRNHVINKFSEILQSAGLAHITHNILIIHYIEFF